MAEKADQKFDPQDFFDLLKAKSKDQVLAITHRIWEEFDENGNGLIEVGEMEQIMRALAKAYANKCGLPMPSDAQIHKVANRIITEIDIDNDGTIDKEEWYLFSCRQAGIER